MLQIAETVLVVCIGMFLLTALFSRNCYPKSEAWYFWILINFLALVLGVVSLFAIPLIFIWR